MVFVAGDLLWYPVEGNPKITQAPDVMVIFGVPKGDQGAYKQWEENNIAPQVVFEILSPSNTQKEMNWRSLLTNDKVERESQNTEKSVNIVGIDLGVKSLATLSTGEVFVGAKSYKKLEAKLYQQDEFSGNEIL